ncbi:unnamed protein product [Lymnaea stagnalis]|uniref:Nudix hydrolase domain-containing protein n=1 Tax=Lymnaea stagnalis TaxID=6523 RepID=A0AAV2HZH7_LYMST
MDPDFGIMHLVEPGQLKASNFITIFLSSDYNKKTYCHCVYSCCTENDCAKHDDFDIISSTTNNLQYDACFHKSPDCENQKSVIDLIWTKRLLENPRLFNATKFRIHHVANCDMEKDKINMYLGVTDYKEFIGSNWAPNAKEIQGKGIELHNNSQAFLSDALGVGASVLTTDNRLILLKRSDHCGEAPGLWDVPGGHAEPMKIVGDKNLEEIDVSSMDSSAVLHEVFDSIIREIVDEVNIPLDQLGEAFYMGTHRNKQSAGRPSLAFVVKCSLSSEEVQALYKQGSQQEAEETTNILLPSLEEVAVMAKEKNNLWNNLAPSAKGNLTIFCLVYLGLCREFLGSELFQTFGPPQIAK